MSRSIDKGLRGSSFGLVVISPDFIRKPWPEYELRGLVAREISEDKVIIPIWHAVNRDQVLAFSPPLADKIAINTIGLEAGDVAIHILRAVRPDIYLKHPRADLERIASGQALHDLQREIEHTRVELEETKEKLSEYQCPYCGAQLSVRIDAPADPLEKHWDLREIYECGYQCFGGYTERPCPSDPRFPKFEDYELKFRHNPREDHLRWECQAWPKTDMARRLSLPIGYGRTKEEAEGFVRKRYNDCVKRVA